MLVNLVDEEITFMIKRIILLKFLENYETNRKITFFRVLTQRQLRVLCMCSVD